MKGIGTLARWLSEDTAAHPTTSSDHSFWSFQNGIFFLRLGLVFPLLPGLQRLLSLELVHISPGWKDTIGQVSVCFCILHIVLWLFGRRFPTKRFTQLPYWQAWVDVLFVTIVVVARAEARGSVVFLYMLPLWTVAHLGPYRSWALHTIAMFLVAFTTILSVPTSGSIAVVLITRGSILVAGVIVLRMYRVAQLKEEREAEDRRREAEEQRKMAEERRREAEEERKMAEERRREAEEGRVIFDGSRCGITVLNKDGSIRRWNMVQKEVFATPQGKDFKEAGLPCYRVFHDQPQPCTWCALDWETVLAADGATIERWLDGETEKHTIDFNALADKVDKGSNWSISNQLRAGEETSDRFHLYYIYFGLLTENDVVTGIVESVAEITEAVLEMPFLLTASKKDEKDKVPEGLPPIAVIRATDDKMVIEMNRAKLRRCQIKGQPPRSKEDVLNLPCGQSYGRPAGEPKCADCMVEKAKSGKPARGITDYPGKALVTAVPVSGPDGKVRAVFEFIDPVDELVAVEEASKAFNALLRDDEQLIPQLIAEGRRRMRGLAGADRCVLLELHERLGINAWSPEESEPTKIAATHVPLVSEMLNKRECLKIADLQKEDKVGKVLRCVAKAHKLGPGVFIPVATPEGDLLAVACLERYETQPQFDDEKIVYCQLLANHLAVSLARARDIQRRRHFIEAMKQTADILDFDAALGTLLEEVAELFPGRMTLAGYALVEKGGKRELKHVGGGDRIVAVEGTIESLLESGAPVTASVDENGSPLSLQLGTRTVRVLPLVYHGQRLLGCIVAETPEADRQRAFPPYVVQLLTLVVNFASIVCGRAELVKACMGTYEHGQGYHLGGTMQVVMQFLEKQSLPGVDEIRHELDLCRDDLRTARKAWLVAIGQTDAITLAPVDPKAMAKKAQDVFRRKGFQADLQVNVAEELECVSCDRVCVEACMRELLWNAFRFREPGTNVHLSLDKKNQKLCISVRNQGQLPDAAEQRAEEMFWRAPQHVDAEIEGTGLGLWQVGTLVRAHPGGEVRLERVGHGKVECLIILDAEC